MPLKQLKPMPEVELVLPEIGTLSSDTDDDDDVEVFLPGNSRAVPEAAIKALLAGERHEKVLWTMLPGTPPNPAAPTSNKLCSEPVHACSRSAQTSTDASHTRADQQDSEASAAALQGLLSSSKIGSELLTRETHQAVQGISPSLRPVSKDASSCGSARVTAATKAGLSAAAPAAAATDIIAFEVAGLKEDGCAPMSSRKSTVAAPSMCSSEGSGSSGEYAAARAGSILGPGSAQTATIAAHSCCCDNGYPAGHVVISADGLVDDLELNDLLLRLSMGQEHFVGSSGNGDSSSSQAAAGAHEAKSTTLESSSTAALWTIQSTETLSTVEGETNNSIQCGSTPDVSGGSVSALPHVYSSYQPRWAKQQQQQSAKPSPGSGAGKPSNSCMAGILSSSASSSSSSASASTSTCGMFCGWGPSRPDKEPRWQPPPRGTVTLDFRKETQPLIGAQRPAATAAAEAAAAAAGADGSAGPSGVSLSCAWRSNSSSAGGASDTDSSEEDWQLFRRQVHSLAATAVAQQ